MADDIKPSLEHGRGVIAAHAKRLPTTAGVYRMLNTKGEPLYIGKAKNLQRRVLSYTQTHRLPVRLQRMVAECVAMEFITTSSEAEALLLEANMIKQHLPRYNVLLRDDKSMPFLLLTADHEFPQLISHRGPKTRKGDYFGPFASAEPVYSTLATLQRVFQLRNCSDHNFAQATRPCLQYHIKRCTAPCVAKVSMAEYAAQVGQVRAFLNGKSNEVQKQLADTMQAASDNLDFEKAAEYRDRIKALATIQARQDINLDGLVDDVDIIAAHQDAGQTCVQVFFFRQGRNYGNKAFFPRHDKGEGAHAVLGAFIGQFYHSRPSAPLVLLSHNVPNQNVLAQALSLSAGSKVELRVPKLGPYARIMAQALQNAVAAHKRHLTQSSQQRVLFEQLADSLQLPAVPERIEIYDNSHLSGTDPVGVMVVASQQGFEKRHYRKYNMKGAMSAGDDYAMMREMLTRRFKRSLSDVPDDESLVLPDLVIIDGGRGQLSVAIDVLKELGLQGPQRIPVLAMAKGPERNKGREVLISDSLGEVALPPDSPVLYLLQRLRDETHRFAVTTQQGKRTQKIGQNKLDHVPGIGAKRKKALLMYFGSAKAVSTARVEDLIKVDGISQQLAEDIYAFFQGGN